MEKSYLLKLFQEWEKEVLKENAAWSEFKKDLFYIL
jgi:hypothetical protein